MVFMRLGINDTLNTKQYNYHNKYLMIVNILNCHI